MRQIVPNVGNSLPLKLRFIKRRLSRVFNKLPTYGLVDC
jgi:hypothetical protein